ncbi:DNA mismatch endonuclease (patch repair protein) [Phyllobacterium trifolii]|uniref:DNA mismatch endonuclease (Patch repair protein) n=1 Tax=Phyllobacterium trifolii TaxID=300193 RepID=A0A839UMF3_9HYPH|nr:very short patch repair endonuclease [Phyllobacterium trifolii]MBB3149771.1 DNA mismatch endonuclease (patch repair protein) [Phyllobacterium trifolii]
MDKLTPQRRSANMARIRSKNTRPELFIRRLLHSLGYRFRIHRSFLPGTPDIVFSKKKCVIFIHGCFWHQHSDPLCKNSTVPKSRQQFWESKLNRNKERDAEHLEQILSLGWSALTVWECELGDVVSLTKRLITFLGPCRHVRSSVANATRLLQASGGLPPGLVVTGANGMDDRNAGSRSERDHPKWIPKAARS